MDIWTKEIGRKYNPQQFKSLGRAYLRTDSRLTTQSMVSSSTYPCPIRLYRTLKPIKRFPPSTKSVRPMMTVQKALESSLRLLGLCRKKWKNPALFLLPKTSQRYSAKRSWRNQSQKNFRGVSFLTTLLTTRKTRLRTGWIAFGLASILLARRDSVNSAALRITSGFTKMKLPSRVLIVVEAGLKPAIVTDTKKMLLAWGGRKERSLWRNLESQKKFSTRTTDHKTNIWNDTNQKATLNRNHRDYHFRKSTF